MCQTPIIENREATEPKPGVTIALARGGDTLTSILKKKTNWVIDTTDSAVSKSKEAQP